MEYTTDRPASARDLPAVEVNLKASSDPGANLILLVLDARNHQVPVVGEDSDLAHFTGPSYLFRHSSSKVVLIFRKGLLQPVLFQV